MSSTEIDEVPAAGQWPVDPQESVPLSQDRIWIDGCFDFAHHGHAGASLQARRLGKELLVGIHSDEAILENKGPTVMNLAERVQAVDACRWVTKSVPHAPYVTSLAWITHYGCKFVGHGDDITSDSSGEDCYRFVKAAGRFKVFKRTPGISTTDLVGRMLLCTRSHFIKSLEAVLQGKEGAGSEEERLATGNEMQQRIKDYATDASGFEPWCEVWSWTPSDREAYKQNLVDDEPGSWKLMVPGKKPLPGQRVIYVDGGFDLFSSGHIGFLHKVLDAEDKLGQESGWFTDEAKSKRISESGSDYGPAYVVAGVHDDHVINHFKGVNYPIMNIFERGLCVLQCRYIHAIVFSAPFVPKKAFLSSLPYGGLPAAVYHGPTSFMPLATDPYKEAKALGIFQEVGAHPYDHVNAGEIVHRILSSRAMYEERQRVKGVKGLGEEAVRRREVLEEEARIKTEQLTGVSQN